MERKASKTVRFTDVGESPEPSSPRGRSPSQSEALAEALAPRVAKFLKAELRRVFAEESASLVEQLQLLQRHYSGEGLSGTSARGLSEQEKEQEQLRKRRLGRMLQCRNGTTSWRSENTGLSDALSECLSSPAKSPRYVDRSAEGPGEEVSFTDLGEVAATATRPSVACPKFVRLQFASLQEDRSGRSACCPGSDSESTTPSPGGGIARRPASCPTISTAASSVAHTQQKHLDSDEEESPVMSWDVESAAGMSEAESIGAAIRRNHQVARANTTGMLKTSTLVPSRHNAIASNPFIACQTEKSSTDLPTDFEGVYDLTRRRAEGADLLRTVQGYGSMGSQASQESQKSIMTIASVTTNRTVVNAHREESTRTSSKFSPVKTQASNGDRACMLGVNESAKKASQGWVGRQQSVKRPLAEIEQSLCAELFKAQELIPMRSRSSMVDEMHREPLLESNKGLPLSNLSWPRWLRWRRRNQKGEESATLPASVVGAPTGEPPLLPVNAKDVEDELNLRGSASAITPRESVKSSIFQNLTLSLSHSQRLGGSRASSPAMTPPTSSRDAASRDARWPRRTMSCSHIRQLQEQRLVEAIMLDGTAEDVPSVGAHAGIENSDSPPLYTVMMDLCRKLTIIVPRLCGVDPWSSRNKWACAIYQWTILALALFCTVLFSWNLQHALSKEPLTVIDEAANLTFVLESILALGAVLGLVACGVLWRSQDIHGTCKMLHCYAWQNGINDEWEKGSLRDFCCSLALWAAAVAVHSLTDQQHMRHAAFAFIGMLHVGITSCILHLCRCLANVIDAFVDTLVESPDVSKAAFNWNLFQAVCRTACGSIQAVFIVQQAMATAAAVVCVADVRNGLGPERVLVLTPSLLMVLAVFRASLWAADISDKCARVPMIVNSLSFGSNDLDHDRMYIVEYIVHSRAGFYVFDVRLTSAAVLKAFYIACAVTVGLASQLML